MAQHDVSKELAVLKAHGYTDEQLKEEFDLFETFVWNRSEQRKVLAKAAEVQEKAKQAEIKSVKQGNSRAYTEPFFTRDGDGWAVVARGVDFITDLSGVVVVKVRRRDGSVSTVEVIEMVDRSSEKVRMWTIQ